MYTNTAMTHASLHALSAAPPQSHTGERNVCLNKHAASNSLADVIWEPLAGCGDVSTLQANVHTLQQFLEGDREVTEVIQRHPLLLAQPLDSWCTFLDAYGLQHAAVSKLLRECPELFTASSIYGTGCTILYFKELGWQDKDIINRIVPYYPNLLAKSVHHDMEPVIHYLEQQGCGQEDVRLLVWEFPRIFCKDYRRYVRKFQYLGVYGLCLHAASHGIM
eukprot:jgi/Chrzof1/2850/Cz12g01060.t1